MKTKKAVIFLNDDCDWCKESKALLDKVGADYIALDVRKNEMAKAISRKMCEGREVCMLIKGEVLTKFDKKKLADAILEDKE